ncbi:MAG: glycosyltransferase WbuB [Anaerolineales bacterium]|nr:glycosyltransferase family 4 protein [Anaerolineae bacterium]PWB54126.1 MAG: glycosyltransferase WbuB [Anaerolineales bacterium]
MHILLIHQAFAALDEPGGTRHHELARYLASQGNRVTIIASPISYLTGKARSARIPWAERQLDGDLITIIRAYTYPALHRSFAYRLVSFFSFMKSSFLIGLGAKDVDLVWGTSPPIFQGLTAWSVARLKGVPFLFEVRDLWPAFAVAVGVLKNPLLVWLSERLERFLYKHADLLVVNSPGFIDHVKSRGAKRVELVPNGTDTLMFSPNLDGKPFRQQHGLDGKFVALYAGAHGLSNDLGTVLKAAQILRPRADIQIVLLGDGKDKPLLQAKAAQAGLGNVLFLPPIAKVDMPAALAAADACIAILKPIEMYKTTYPNKVFDYMAAGKPVVLAIDGVIREVVVQAGGGIPIQPGDPAALAQAILQLADDPKAAHQMGLNARSYVETHFDRNELATNLLVLINNLAV